jgi:Fic family protein
MERNPCLPPDLPVTNLNWQRLVPLVGRANDAVLSCGIEGTQATLEEVFQQSAGMEPPIERQDDIEEVSNYRAALRQAELELVDRQFSLSMHKAVHQRLMQGVCGHDKKPGEFRTDQNWIGRPHSPLEEARFIPPNPIILPQALENWAQ